MDSKKFKAGDTLHFDLDDVYGGVAAGFGLPEVHDQVLCLLHTEDKIVGGAP